MPTAHTIAAGTHGRYLIEATESAPPAGFLIGFHGYAEAAEAQLDRMRSVPGSSSWLLVSLQGLHRFYNRRSQDIVASWMTRQDWELAIVDNLRYVSDVVETIAGTSSPELPIVFAGFSQGAAMAFRAACALPAASAAVVAVGGDAPPELDATALGRVKAAFLARGSSDEWYDAEKWKSDERRLREAGVQVRAVQFDAGHEWTAGISAAIGDFLAQITLARSLPR